MKTTGVLCALWSTAGGCGGLTGRQGTVGNRSAYKETPGMADDGRGLSTNTGDANKRLKTMGTSEFA